MPRGRRLTNVRHVINGKIVYLTIQIKTILVHRIPNCSQYSFSHSKFYEKCPLNYVHKKGSTWKVSVLTLSTNFFLKTLSIRTLSQRKFATKAIFKNMQEQSGHENSFHKRLQCTAFDKW